MQNIYEDYPFMGSQQLRDEWLNFDDNFTMNKSNLNSNASEKFQNYQNEGK